MVQSELIQILHSEFERKRQRNPRFSMRSFARFLGVAPSTLVRVMNGSRSVTPGMADRILRNLEIDPSRKSSLLLALLALLALLHAPSRPEALERKYTPVAEAAMALLGGWEHFAVLSTIELHPDWICDARTIARRLGLPLVRAKAALAALEGAGGVRREGTRWRLTGAALTMPASQDPAAARALRGAHRDYIEMAARALEVQPGGARDISGITMAIPRAKLAEAFRRIREFRRTLAQYLTADDMLKDDVYRLNIQLFPVTARARRAPR